MERILNGQAHTGHRSIEQPRRARPLQPPAITHRYLRHMRLAGCHSRSTRHFVVKHGLHLATTVHTATANGTDDSSSAARSACAGADLAGGTRLRFLRAFTHARGTRHEVDVVILAVATLAMGRGGRRAWGVSLNNCTTQLRWVAGVNAPWDGLLERAASCRSHWQRHEFVRRRVRLARVKTPTPFLVLRCVPARGHGAPRHGCLPGHDRDLGPGQVHVRLTGGHHGAGHSQCGGSRRPSRRRSAAWVHGLVHQTRAGCVTRPTQRCVRGASTVEVDRASGDDVGKHVQQSLWREHRHECSRHIRQRNYLCP